jgi:hypothetical protein
MGLLKVCPKQRSLRADVCILEGTNMALKVLELGREGPSNGKNLINGYLESLNGCGRHCGGVGRG